jgi:OPA family glycerol-3-phosphate transporter-like MFS transporter 1/2
VGKQIFKHHYYYVVRFYTEHDNYEVLLGSLDYAYLFAYAISMFISGHIAERMNLRTYLAIGMFGSGILTAAFGMGYYWKVHSLVYYLGVQVGFQISESFHHRF